MLKAIDKSTYEEHLSQPLQTNYKQFKITVTFVTGYIDIFNVPKSNNKFHFKKTIRHGHDFIQITIPQAAYETKSLKKEIKRIIIDEGHYTEEDYPLTIKGNFSKL